PARPTPGATEFIRQRRTIPPPGPNFDNSSQLYTRLSQDIPASPRNPSVPELNPSSLRKISDMKPRIGSRKNAATTTIVMMRPRRPAVADAEPRRVMVLTWPPLHLHRTIHSSGR